LQCLLDNSAAHSRLGSKRLFDAAGAGGVFVARVLPPAVEHPMPGLDFLVL